MIGPVLKLTVVLVAGALNMKVGEGTVSLTGERFEKVIVLVPSYAIEPAPAPLAVYVSL